MVEPIGNQLTSFAATDSGALVSATLAGDVDDPSPSRRAESIHRPLHQGVRVVRPLRYSINVTLDGCCDHREVIADDDLHRNAAESLAQADALLFGRVTYEMMEAAWRGPAPEGARPDWMEPFARRSTPQRSTSCRAPSTGSIGTPSWSAGIWGRPFKSSSGSRVKDCSWEA